MQCHIKPRPCAGVFLASVSKSGRMASPIPGRVSGEGRAVAPCALSAAGASACAAWKRFHDRDCCRCRLSLEWMSNRFGVWRGFDAWHAFPIRYRPPGRMQSRLGLMRARHLPVDLRRIYSPFRYFGESMETGCFVGTSFGRAPAPAKVVLPRLHRHAATVRNGQCPWGNIHQGLSHQGISHQGISMELV